MSVKSVLHKLIDELIGEPETELRRIALHTELDEPEVNDTPKGEE